MDKTGMSAADMFGATEPTNTMTPLDLLIDDIERGEFCDERRAFTALGNALVGGMACRAYRGSIDAGIYLLNALLPDYGWRLGNGGRASVTTPGYHAAYSYDNASSPARALLLATLIAYKAKMK